jgi:nitroreductase
MRYAALALLLLVPACSRREATKAQTMPPSSRPLPATDVNASEVLRALSKRRTSREFSAKPLDHHLLANLLWAGNGVNRADGGRTAPSAHNTQSIDIYVADATGLYRYDARRPALDLIKSGDLRALTGLQAYAATAPVDLVLVNDDRKFAAKFSAEERALFAAAGAGAVMENIYVFCAANDLAVAVRADIDRAALAAAMGLAPEQKIMLAQSVGYPPTLAALKSAIKGLLGRN